MKVVYDADPVMDLQKVAEELKKVPQLKRPISAIKGQDIEYLPLYQIDWERNGTSCQ